MSAIVRNPGNYTMSMLSPAHLLRRTYGTAQMFWRDHSPKGRQVARRRAETEIMLDSFARSSGERFSGTVLVDGTFDNPNYWFRYSLLRAALGFAHSREFGLTGPYRRRHVRETFERFGFAGNVDFTLAPSDATRIDATADELVSFAYNAEDVLNWKLPSGVHASIVYDGILKRQRLAALDIRHPLMHEHTREALRNIARANEILDEIRPDLLIISHPFSFGCGSLAWLAIARGIPTILPFGLFGVLRFARFRTTTDLFQFYDRPGRCDMDELPPARAEALRGIGRAYLDRRFSGKADDLASIYAYQRNRGDIDRAGLCARFGWDPKRRIVAIYGSNWFDWPHQLGMTQFRDFLDWIEASFDAAQDNDRVNWLFKPHPTEDWFGGVALSEILSRRKAMPHVAIAEKSWNNAAVMRSVDALITYHGTSGIEFASLGKPVLVPDRGKYEDSGFVCVARSRKHYLELLASEWWRDIDLVDARRRAEIFAGWWFCAPDWQRGFVLSDDARQDALYDIIPLLLQGNPCEAAREVEMIRAWWAGGQPHYHTWKMAQADAFQLSNVE